MDGHFSLVPYAHEADVIIVRVELDGRGDSLVIVPVPADGIRVRRQKVIGGEPRAGVILDGVRIGVSDVIGAPPERVQAVLTGRSMSPRF